MNNLFKNHRQIIAIYLLWVFINIVIWVMSRGDTSDFWPFDGGDLTGSHGDYDFSEFLVYAIGPAFLYFIYSLFNKKD